MMKICPICSAQAKPLILKTPTSSERKVIFAPPLTPQQEQYKCTRRRCGQIFYGAEGGHEELTMNINPAFIGHGGESSTDDINPPQMQRGPAAAAAFVPPQMQRGAVPLRRTAAVSDAELYESLSQKSSPSGSPQVPRRELRPVQPLPPHQLRPVQPLPPVPDLADAAREALQQFYRQSFARMRRVLVEEDPGNEHTYSAPSKKGYTPSQRLTLNILNSYERATRQDSQRLNLDCVVQLENVNRWDIEDLGVVAPAILAEYPGLQQMEVWPDLFADPRIMAVTLNEENGQGGIYVSTEEFANTAQELEELRLIPERPTDRNMWVAERYRSEIIQDQRTSAHKTMIFKHLNKDEELGYRAGIKADLISSQHIRRDILKRKRELHGNLQARLKELQSRSSKLGADGDTIYGQADSPTVSAQRRIIPSLIQMVQQALDKAVFADHSQQTAPTAANSNIHEPSPACDLCGLTYPYHLDGDALENIAIGTFGLSSPMVPQCANKQHFVHTSCAHNKLLDKLTEFAKTHSSTTAEQKIQLVREWYQTHYACGCDKQTTMCVFCQQPTEEVSKWDDSAMIFRRFTSQFGLIGLTCLSPAHELCLTNAIVKQPAIDVLLKSKAARENRKSETAKATIDIAIQAEVDKIKAEQAIQGYAIRFAELAPAATQQPAAVAQTASVSATVASSIRPSRHSVYSKQGSYAALADASHYGDARPVASATGSHYQHVQPATAATATYGTTATVAGSRPVESMYPKYTYIHPADMALGEPYAGYASLPAGASSLQAYQYLPTGRPRSEEYQTVDGQLEYRDFPGGQVSRSPRSSSPRVNVGNQGYLDVTAGSAPTGYLDVQPRRLSAANDGIESLLRAARPFEYMSRAELERLYGDIDDEDNPEQHYELTPAQQVSNATRTTTTEFVFSVPNTGASLPSALKRSSIVFPEITFCAKGTGCFLQHCGCCWCWNPEKLQAWKAQQMRMGLSLVECLRSGRARTTREAIEMTGLGGPNAQFLDMPAGGDTITQQPLAMGSTGGSARYERLMEQYKIMGPKPNALNCMQMIYAWVACMGFSRTKKLGWLGMSRTACIEWMDGQPDATLIEGRLRWGQLVFDGCFAVGLCFSVGSYVGITLMAGGKAAETAGPSAVNGTASPTTTTIFVPTSSLYPNSTNVTTTTLSPSTSSLFPNSTNGTTTTLSPLTTTSPFNGTTNGTTTAQFTTTIANSTTAVPTSTYSTATTTTTSTTSIATGNVTTTTTTPRSNTSTTTTTPSVSNTTVTSTAATVIVTTNVTPTTTNTSVTITANGTTTVTTLPPTTTTTTPITQNTTVTTTLAPETTTHQASNTTTVAVNTTTGPVIINTTVTTTTTTTTVSLPKNTTTTTATTTTTTTNAACSRCGTPFCVSFPGSSLCTICNTPTCL